jgi:hypothetical protein
MKLSNDTLNVLKNFASINSNVLFKKGKTVKIVSPRRNILAEAVISEEIPRQFGIYDLNNFLSVLSIHDSDMTLDFDDKNVLISGYKGRSKMKYRFCPEKMITVPPEQGIAMPNPEISFDLSNEDVEWILRVANVLSSPQIVVESDGKTINITVLDLQDDAAHTDSIEICNGNGDVYNMIFKTENWKLLPGSYEVNISSKGIAHFKHKSVDIQYWVTTEAGTTFKGAK